MSSTSSRVWARVHIGNAWRGLGDCDAGLVRNAPAAPHCFHGEVGGGGGDGGMRLVELHDMGRNGKTEKRYKTYLVKPTVSANSRRSDLRWPRRKLFVELDMTSVCLDG